MNIYIFTKLRSILNKLNTLKNGIGLGEDYGYTPDQTTRFLQTASSLKNADTILDGVLGKATDEINIMGLQINGTPVINSSGQWLGNNDQLRGAQGTSGVQGFQGIQGIRGTDGIDGIGTQGIIGNQGLQGVIGNQGLQGTQGLQGLQGIGIQGIQGIQGTVGQNGNSIQLRGTVISPSQLPGSATIGDLYVVSGTGTGYTAGDGFVYNSSSQWINIGQIRGVQGLQGLTGAGIQGPLGFQGLQGNLGLQGVQGSQGIQGRQGIQGNLGLQGLKGNTGIGEQGVQGLIGIQGTQGIQGSVGNVSYDIIISTRQPTNADGKNGDFWITYY